MHMKSFCLLAEQTLGTSSNSERFCKHQKVLRSNSEKSYRKSSYIAVSCPFKLQTMALRVRFSRLSTLTMRKSVTKCLKDLPHSSGKVFLGRVLCSIDPNQIYLSIKNHKMQRKAIIIILLIKLIENNFITHNRIISP